MSCATPALPAKKTEGLNHQDHQQEQSYQATMAKGDVHSGQTLIMMFRRASGC